MGLFDRGSKSREDAPLSPVEGLAGIAVAAVYADGSMNAEEDRDLQAYLWKLKAFRRLADKEVDAVFRKVQSIALADGDDALLDASASAVTADLKPTAFFVAADLVMGDDDFGDEEQSFLDALRTRLGVDETTARTITDALAIKYRG